MHPPSAAGVCTALGVAAAAGLAYGGFTYASLSPGSRLFGTGLTAPARPGELALTFDDGPNPKWTPLLLDTLGANEVRATFFLIGSVASAQPDLVRRIAAGGHLIGDHTWTHPNLARSSASRIQSELSQTKDLLEQITGKPIKFFRPPFGARRPAVFRIARELGLQVVLWNAMTTDWNLPSPDRIAGNLARKIVRHRQRGRATNIVLHDGGHRDLNANREPSITAAAKLIAQFKPDSRFVTLDAWF